MNILLTNDDGINAPGLGFLYKKLSGLGKILVVAPDQCKSGASHSITLTPITCEKVKTDTFTGYSVTGFPADCVKLAIREIADQSFDLVISGINNGANAGVNIHYSGTVAGASEAALQGIPAVALSTTFEMAADPKKLEHACEIGVKVLKHILPLESGDLININIPDLAVEQENKEVRIAVQSNVLFKEKYDLLSDENGRKVYQIGGMPDYSGPANNDMAYLDKNFITVTALHMDRTDYKLNQKLESLDFSKIL